MKDKNSKLESIIRELLIELAEDPEREGLRDTPARVAKSLKYLTSGYQMSEKDLIKGAMFSEEENEMVLVKDIDFFSLCEHHLLPFYGKAHIAYIPEKQIIGISKIARLVDVYARRLQVQERLTRQIAYGIEKNLKPKGIAVVMEAFHLCMAMRGVEKQNAVTVTSTMLGVFRDNQATRMEFLNLIGRTGY